MPTQRPAPTDYSPTRRANRQALSTQDDWRSSMVTPSLEQNHGVNPTDLIAHGDSGYGISTNDMNFDMLVTDSFPAIADTGDALLTTTKQTSSKEGGKWKASVEEHAETPHVWGPGDDLALRSSVHIVEGNFVTNVRDVVRVPLAIFATRFYTHDSTDEKAIRDGMVTPYNHDQIK
ncbi:hypothetical protein LTR86_010397 [Recurvomyces mirabilis]|nr:hypothetical protein LTR86_010397 [Recurvomyces mirabilis]